MASALRCSTWAAPLHNADSIYGGGIIPPANGIWLEWLKTAHAPRNGMFCPYSVLGVVTGIASDGYWKVFRSKSTFWRSIGDPNTLDNAPPWTWAQNGTVSEVSDETTNHSLWMDAVTTTSGIVHGSGQQWLYAVIGGYGIDFHGRVNYGHEEHAEQLLVNTDHEVEFGTVYDIYSDTGDWVARGIVGTRYYNGETFTEAMARAWAVYEEAPSLESFMPDGPTVYTNYSRNDSGVLISGTAITNPNAYANWPYFCMAGTSGGHILDDPPWAFASSLLGVVIRVKEPAWYLRSDTYGWKPYVEDIGILSEITHTAYAAQTPLDNELFILEAPNPAAGYVDVIAEPGEVPDPGTHSPISDDPTRIDTDDRIIDR
jgi:hypothetical protein